MCIGPFYDSYQQKDYNTFFFFYSQTIQRALSMCTQNGKPTFSWQYSVELEYSMHSPTTAGHINP